MIRTILGLSAVLAVCSVAAQEAPEHQHHHPKTTPPPAAPAQEHMKHGGAPAADGEHHDHHGMIAPESREFPTIAYDDTRTARAPQKTVPPPTPGNPHQGKQLAYNPEKGRCLSCHVLGPDGEQPGTVGPNLSDYARRGVSPAQTFQQIWDARVRNPHSVMPAFGTNTLLTAEEVADITAYLHKLDMPVNSPAPLIQDTRGVWIVGEDFTRADDVIDDGQRLFQLPGNNGKSCATCHTPGGSGPDLKGVAATYPKWDAQRKRIVALEQRVNLCRMQNMNSDHYPLGSRESNVLTSYVKYLARRTPLNVATDGDAKEAIVRGKASFYRRAGQLNFSCANCHAPEQPVAGRWMRGDVIQAMTDGGGHRNVAAQWPKHFIGGHDLGLQSLQQRIEHCQAVTRTFPLQLGSPEYVELELFLTSQGNGAPLLAPTLTRLRGE
jgi:sulfur-oxidizing protein SoxA